MDRKLKAIDPVQRFSPALAVLSRSVPGDPPEVGLPDDIWRELVYAVITRHQDATLSEEEIISYCKGLLGGINAHAA